MITILASLIGFVSSSIPSVLKVYKHKNDLNHNLEILKIKQQLKDEGKEFEYDISVPQSEVDYNQIEIKKNQPFVYYLNESVRPIIAYGMFFQYIWIRYQILPYLDNENIDVKFVIETLWDNEDMAILSGIISFYFGTKFFEGK